MLTATNKFKEERLELRINEVCKNMIERAAGLAGITTSAFIVLNALKAAKKQISAEERLILSDRDRDIFLSAFDVGMTPNATLKGAVSRFKKKYPSE